jgi:hypothetical protein
MTASARIDWSDVREAARLMAGNWWKFDSFAWHRGYRLEDADRWMIWYTSGRDARLLVQSNHAAITQRLAAFLEGDDPDVVAEVHDHWAVGDLQGFSIRVFRRDGTITDAFKVFCSIKERLEDYPVLDEADYSQREYEATLENYRSEMWRLKDDLPAGWEAEVYSWFSDHGLDRHIEDCDDQGGYAPREAISMALQDLGLLPTVVVQK